MNLCIRMCTNDISIIYVLGSVSRLSACSSINYGNKRHSLDRFDYYDVKARIISANKICGVGQAGKCRKISVCSLSVLRVGVRPWPFLENNQQRSRKFHRQSIDCTCACYKHHAQVDQKINVFVFDKAITQISNQLLTKTFSFATIIRLKKGRARHLKKYWFISNYSPTSI